MPVIRYRGKRLADAAEMYRAFLLELANGELSDEQILDILDEADILLNIAYDKGESVGAR